MNTLAQLEEALGRLDVVELAHVLEEDIPIWPTHSRFYKMVWHSPAKGDGSLNHQIILNEHNGTHVDSPAHYFLEKGPRIDAMPVQTYFGPCAVFDLRHLGANGEATAKHFLAWEAKNGQLRRNDIVILNYGWHKFWKKMPDHLPYITDYPGLGKDGAELLLERGIKMVCCDTLSVDAIKNSHDPAHHVLLGNGISVMENLTNLDRLPPRCYFLSLPLRIRDGSGSPVRPLALVPQGNC